LKLERATGIARGIKSNPRKSGELETFISVDEIKGCTWF